MRIVIRVVSLAALLLTIAWLVYDPAFNSAVATVSSLAALLSSFLIRKPTSELEARQSQKVSSDSIGVQAGGNVHIDKIEK